MQPNRIVAILTPLVFAPAAGFITAWAAQNLPGLPALDSAEITALFGAGATIALAKAALWMHGWHLHMQSPDGQVGKPADDDELVNAARINNTQQHPPGDFDPTADFAFQPHIESNGHGAGALIS